MAVAVAAAAPRVELRRIVKGTALSKRQTRLTGRRRRRPERNNLRMEKEAGQSDSPLLKVRQKF